MKKLLKILFFQKKQSDEARLNTLIEKIKSHQNTKKQEEIDEEFLMERRIEIFFERQKNKEQL